MAHSPAQPSLPQADEAWAQGRVADALALYASLADVSVPVPTRREALLAQGLLTLDPASPHHNLEAAHALLVAARALYDTPPLPLVSSLALAEHLMAVRAELGALEDGRGHHTQGVATLARQAEALDEENRTLKRTVRQLRSDVEQRDALLRKARADVEQRDTSLRKAAEAVLGTPASAGPASGSPAAGAASPPRP